MLSKNSFDERSRFLKTGEDQTNLIPKSVTCLEVQKTKRIMVFSKGRRPVGPEEGTLENVKVLRTGQKKTHRPCGSDGSCEGWKGYRRNSNKSPVPWISSKASAMRCAHVTSGRPPCSWLKYASRITSLLALS